MKNLMTSVRNFLKAANRDNLCVVIGLNNSTGLSIVRDLGSHGVHVIGMDSTFSSIGRYSKYCDIFIRFYDEKNLLKNLTTMGTYLKKKIPILVASDRLVIFMERNKDSLSEFYLFYWQTNIKLEALMDKHKMMQFADDAGLDVPLTFYSSKTPSDIIENSIKFPAVIKPLYTRSSVKLLVLNTLEEFKTAIKRNLFSKGYIVQEMVQGPEKNIYLAGTFSDEKGYIVASAHGRKLRQFPKNFGTASLAISDQNEIVRQLSEKLTRHLKYYGPADIEFKQSAIDGKYIFIEINPRFPGFNQLFISSGCNLAYISYLGLIKEPKPDRVRPQNRNEVQYMSILDDFRSCFNYYQNISIIRWFKDLIKSSSFAVFSIADLCPFFILLKNAANSKLSKILRN